MIEVRDSILALLCFSFTKNNPMKKITITLCLLLASFLSYAQLTSVVTDKADEAMGKYKPFVLVDMATQLVLAREPVKYDPEAEMPTCYFSSLPAIDAGLTTAANYRFMAINTLPVVDGQNWVICENRETKTTIFSRRKFLSDLRAQYLWVPVINGDYVMFLNLSGVTNRNWGGFLTIHEDGSFSSAKNEAEASQWKLIWAK